MQISFVVLFLIAGAGLMLILLGFLIYKVLYNRYLNKRLKGEGRKLNFFSYKVFAIFMAFLICVSLISLLSVSLIQARAAMDDCNKNHKNLDVKQIEITDFNSSPEYKEFCNALKKGNLLGYEISLRTDGDFECYFAVPKGAIKNAFFMPGYYVYICYKGEPLDDETAQMERRLYYDKDGHDFTAVGKFEPELLLIGNNLEPNFYIRVETIIKIAPKTEDTKINWDSLPVYAKSNFEISNL